MSMTGGREGKQNGDSHSVNERGDATTGGESGPVLLQKTRPTATSQKRIIN